MSRYLLEYFSRTVLIFCLPFDLREGCKCSSMTNPVSCAKIYSLYSGKYREPIEQDLSIQSYVHTWIITSKIILRSADGPLDYNFLQKGPIALRD